MLFELEPRLVEAWEAPVRMTLHTSSGPVEVAEGQWVVHAVTLKGEGATIENAFSIKSADEWKREHPKPYFGDTNTTEATVTTNTARRIAAHRETLAVPPAHPPLNPNTTISDRILSTVGNTPMASKDIVQAVGGNPANTRSAIARMAKSGALKRAGRGAYRIGRAR